MVDHELKLRVPYNATYLTTEPSGSGFSNWMQTNIAAAVADTGSVDEIHRGAMEDEAQRSFDVSAVNFPTDLENVAVPNKPFLTPSSMANVIQNDELHHLSRKEPTFDKF
ncbi:unnamed protein product [Gongylonema pulchrum]|uniref:Uncharacterized protein n=1 Tax=Gongylonema pulchrum TaxID=637853 RepID=A0A183DI49_9BILA|nr:unnamed protein product [Gongylonema pulchrum]